jgi:1-acyl-sn-glycerol-3-phosphate acyltransferase
MAFRRIGEIGAGPLFPPAGSASQRTFRRVRGIVAEIIAFVLVTVLLPLLLLVGLLVDLFLKVTRGKPMVAVRLAAFLWSFLATEMFAMVALLAIWIGSGGPFGKNGERRRRGIYWLRPRWARSHLGMIQLLFGIDIQVEGTEAALPGRFTLMIRHASIIDNMLPDVLVAGPNGLGIRYVVKRELEAIPVIDIGGRWVPTQFLERISKDPEGEIATMRRLWEDVGPDEAVLIYPEGTRATQKKIARAKEIVRERQPDVAPLAEPLVNLLPPRLGGPLALLEEGEGNDVLFVAHAGFDGYEYISDIWAGGLVGATIRVKMWRVPATEIPADERGRTEWLYEHWLRMDEWVTEQLADLDHVSITGKAVAPDKQETVV